MAKEGIGFALETVGEILECFMNLLRSDRA